MMFGLKDIISCRILLASIAIFLLSGSLSALDWPVFPDSAIHRIGNSYGQYQNYGSKSYYHPGIDIMAPAGTPVYAVKSGYVKAVLTISAELHWRVAIGDSAGAAECDGWLYAHLDEKSIAANEGDRVEAGDFLGNLVEWPTAEFHHLHFVKIRHSGVTWDSDWQFIGNPLDELDNIPDHDAPVFENVMDGQPLAFCRNESDDFFEEGEALNGPVDIVARIYDYINHPEWKLSPYKIEYKIEGDTLIDWTPVVTFSGELDYDHAIDVLFREDECCGSQSDYDNRVFYFNLTNTDSDSLIEISDRTESWKTGYFHNGDYTVSVRASDRAGNATTIQMPVAIENYSDFEGIIVFEDGRPFNSGVEIAVTPDGQTISADKDGKFALTVGGGWQNIRITCPGYQTIDTTLLMNNNCQLLVTLPPVNFVRADANFDGRFNIADAAHIINYVFFDGHAPEPYLAGDVNHDASVNIADASLIIESIFENRSELAY